MLCRVNENKCDSGYYYKDPYFVGLTHSHFISGSCVPNYGSASLIPSLTLDINAAVNFHSLDHDNEEWTPAFYRVTLPESGLVLEAVNDNRAGVVRFDASTVQQDSFYVIIMAFDTMYNESYVDILSNTSVQLSNPAHRWYQASGRSAGFDGHHHIQFSQEAKSFGIIQDYSQVTPGATSGESSHKTGNAAAYFEFSTSSLSSSSSVNNNAPGEVFAAIGSSFVSRDKARNNAVAELGPSGSAQMFDQASVRERVTMEWERRLATVSVEATAPVKEDPGAEASALRMFYTAMWHSLLAPRIYSDYDGEYLSFAGSEKVMQQEEGFTYFDDYSEWDIYRATLPLQFIVAPDIVPSLVRSLVNKADQGGWLPIFPAWNSYTNEMIGDHCSVLMVDAFMKGILNVEDDRDFAEKVYAVMRHNALDVPPMDDIMQGKGRRGIESYLKFGFIPLQNPVPFAFHDGEQVSRTLEFSYDDYVVAQMADLLGHTADRDLLLQHSEGYKMVVDADGVGFVRGRYMNLTWFGEDADFDPDEHYDWVTEGSPYQYTWYVPHNVEDLIKLYKGPEAFVQKLTTFFEGGSYNHGNEPDHQAAFMFPYVTGIGTEGKDTVKGEYEGMDMRGEAATVGAEAGAGVGAVSAAWRTQYQVDSILRNQYADGPGGLAGNDDAGQTSSWYALAALGLYQVCPGCGGHSEYVLTTPQFALATVDTGSDSNGSGSGSGAKGRGGNGQVFRIVAPRVSAHDIYIQSATLNGADYNCAFLPHRVLAEGGTLEFVLGSQPSESWGNTGRSCLDKYFGIA